MSQMPLKLLVNFVFYLIKIGFCTIDLNESELKYLADHLTPEECRILVSAAHYESFNVPAALDQAEHKLPHDESCIALIKHWNLNEGKFQSHEVLEHRLKQMNKNKLANWLGKTVFLQLGRDLERSLQEGLKNVINDTSSSTEDLDIGPTLYPDVQNIDPKEWRPVDSVLFALLAILMCFLVYLCCKMGFILHTRKKMQNNLTRRSNTSNTNTYKKYESLDELDFTDTEDEEKFDVRNYK